MEKTPKPTIQKAFKVAASFFALLSAYYLPIAHSTADSFLDQARNLSKTLINPIVSPHERAERLSPEKSSKSIWNTFEDREGFYFYQMYPALYGRDKDSQFYFSIGTNLILNKLGPLQIDLSTLEVSLNGFHYEMGGDITFQGIDDVTMLTDIFQEQDHSKRLLGSFLSTKLFNPELFLPSFLYD